LSLNSRLIKRPAILLHRMSPLLAQSGHFSIEFQCPLWGGKADMVGHPILNHTQLLRNRLHI
jgi:hypothetical protein